MRKARAWREEKLKGILDKKGSFSNSNRKKKTTTAKKIWSKFIIRNNLPYRRKFQYFSNIFNKIYRGYYTAARRYEFYFRVVKTIFYERAQRVSKILFLTRENNIHIFKPPCNVLFII